MSDYSRVDASKPMDTMSCCGKTIQYLARLEDYDEYGVELVLCKLIVDGKEIDTDSVDDMKAALDAEYFDTAMKYIHREHIRLIESERTRRVEPIVGEVMRFAEAWTKPVMPQDPGFRFSDEAKPHVLRLMDLALAENGNDSDAASPAMWGPCHLAANRLDAWIQTACNRGGTWVWTAILEACGVDVARMIAKHN